jgi:uncharacterized protein with von Willebrand factor type A (vWA) domain
VRIRYGRWSGTQDPFPAGVSADEVLDELSDDLLSGYSADEALQRLVQRGMDGRFGGLDALRRRVEAARRRELERMGLDGPMQRIAEQLGDIVERERVAAEWDATDRGPARREALDALPEGVAERLNALRAHDWADPQAKADFDALLERLRADVAEATFGRLAGALGQMGPADLERMRDLLADLNALIDARDRGEDVSSAYASFRERHREALGDLADQPTLDDLLAELARRMAALSRMMAGLDPSQREQLARMAADLLGDMDLGFETDRLRRSLQQQFPELGWDQAMRGAMPAGEEAGGWSQTVDWMEHLQEVEDLAEALGQDYPGARLEDVDEDRLREVAGDDAVRDLRALREIERALEAAGAANRQQGRLELTPRGIRRLGETTLARLYERAMQGRAGSHATPADGGDGELTGATRALRYGDPFRLHVSRTIGNAVQRGAAVGTGVSLRPEDFELAESERRVAAVTVLLLDMSFSMPLRGNWVPAKRVALALQALIAGKFPEDRFHIIGFSDYARRLQPRDLLAAGWERVYGTNMQHAFQMTRRLLGTYPGAEAQVIMITDGEPTARLVGSEALFGWPPEPETLRVTMQEAARLARTGATLNVFLLDHDEGAAAFIERMVGAYGGRIFYPDLDDLGALVVRDFLNHRR